MGYVRKLSTLIVMFIVVISIISACGSKKKDETGIIYTNASLTGPWLVMVTGLPDSNVYITFDGAGAIYDFGALNVDTTNPGGYSVSSSGTFSITLNYLTPLTAPLVEQITGGISSATTGTFNLGVLQGTINKISDLSACQGDWTGKLTNSGGSKAAYNVGLTTDPSGIITVVTNTASTGNQIDPLKLNSMYCQESNMVSHFYLLKQPGVYEQIRLAGTVASNVVTGTFSSVTSDPTISPSSQSGTFSFTRQVWR
jgi:hypothetical protein